MEISDLFKKRFEKLRFYFPFSFLRQIDSQKQQEYVYHHQLGEMRFVITIQGNTFIFCYTELAWESNFFGINSIKLNTVLFDDTLGFKEAIAQFLEQLPNQTYIFSELPSEDNILFQHLGNACFKLVETRLTYYHKTLFHFNNERYPVRKATEMEIANLSRVAKEMTNIYDRFHSDIDFSSNRADDYLATYIKNSIQGFADVVLIPNQEGVPSDSFLTAKYLTDQWAEIGAKVSRMVLSAVSNSTNRGWYYKLVSELTYHLRDEVGTEAIFLTTQSTNRAVFHTWEKLGYKLGYTTHIFSYFKK